MFKRVWRQLRKDFLVSHHARALPFGLILGLLAVVPFVMMCVNLLLLYVRFVYLYLFIINAAVALALMLGGFIYGVTLKNYQPRSTLKPIEIALTVALVLGAVVFAMGTILIFRITPNFI